MWFNPILEVANKNKDEKAYNDEGETENMEREDKFYRLFKDPRA